MKALSVRQPWAWLLVNSYKDVENRSWGTRYRGTLLIHAGKAFDAEGYRWVAETFPAIPLPRRQDFELGGIVGSVVLDDCVPPGSDLNGVCESEWYFGEYGWLAIQATRLPFIPFNGRLGLFDVELPPGASQRAHAPTASGLR